jgi:hypothetical protein
MVGCLATAISWLLTFLAVCIGYVFFRAESIRQAVAMLKAIASPHSYRHTLLDHSFYLMTFLAAAGYFAIIGAGAVLDHLEKNSAAGRFRNLLSALAAERWVWITPIIVVLAIYLSVIFQPGHAETGPVMYALF